MAGSLLMSISQDERERAVFRSRRMFQTDKESDIATAEDRGIRIGRVEGVLDVARSLLSEGDSIDKIIKVTGLTFEEVENLSLAV